MARKNTESRVGIRDSYMRLNLSELRPLARLVSADAPTGKAGIVPFLAKAMSREANVRRLYDSLDETNRSAVQMAAHDPDGQLAMERFRAIHSRTPSFGTSKTPTALALFLPRDWQVPIDLQAILKSFVPPPPAFTIATIDELPETVRLGPESSHEEEEVPLRIRATAPVAERELRAVLRLIEAGRVRVSDKTRRPIGETIDAVRSVLTSGDFFDPSESREYRDEPVNDLTIRAAAWPALVQAAGLAATSRNILELTDAGRKAMGQPPHVVLRTAWRRWLTTTDFDEFHRVDAIKGQRKAGLTAVSGRRKPVVEALRGCPPGRWVGVDDFFRYMRAMGLRFEICRDDWDLYISDPQYGSLGYDDPHTWEQLQGRFILAMLFEPAATLGLIDVAYIPPQRARDDFSSRWGSDDQSCLSRYDGLKFLRLNPLGAWCLDLAEEYHPEPSASAPHFRILPNLDVVALQRPPDPADVLMLDRVAERTSDSVWKLDRGKILAAVERGMAPAELEAFLVENGQGPLPQPVQVLMTDLSAQAGRLRDLGTVRLIECADAETAQLLAADRSLAKLCQRAGDRSLVFLVEDEAALRARLRKLGYVLPPL